MSRVQAALHKHEAVLHTHDHPHVVHHLKGGDAAEVEHLSASHNHEHNHVAVEHSHDAHKNLQREHQHEGHIHDHANPTAGRR